MGALAGWDAIAFCPNRAHRGSDRRPVAGDLEALQAVPVGRRFKRLFTNYIDLTICQPCPEVFEQDQPSFDSTENSVASSTRPLPAMPESLTAHSNQKPSQLKRGGGDWETPPGFLGTSGPGHSSLHFLHRFSYETQGHSF
jgi:hypothetical protein